MGKVSHKVFKAVPNKLSKLLPIMGELVSKVSYFITKPREFIEVTRLSADTRKTWLKANLKEINNLIINQTFLVDKPEKIEPVTLCMDVYEAKIQSDGSLDKLKSRIVVRRDLHNKDLIGDIWSPTVSMRNLKYLLSYYVKHKARVHQLDFIGALLQAKVKTRVFVKLDSSYADYFQNITVILEYP